MPDYPSQPARAVWIEIREEAKEEQEEDSHSLRGLCGLKYDDSTNVPYTLLSQPARAVWIEISNL